MIEINIGALVVLLGIPTAVTGFCFWMLEHRIQNKQSAGIVCRAYEKRTGSG